MTIDAATPAAPPPYRVWKTPEIRRAVAAFEAMGYEVTGFESTAGGFRLLTRKRHAPGVTPEKSRDDEAPDNTADETPDDEIARRRAQLAARRPAAPEGRLSEPATR